MSCSLSLETTSASTSGQVRASVSPPYRWAVSASSALSLSRSFMPHRNPQRCGACVAKLHHCERTIMSSDPVNVVELPQLHAAAGQRHGRLGARLALDDAADGPVELRLGDKVIARGHLVASGDRLGVRISEIRAE